MKVKNSFIHLPSLPVADTVQVPQDMETLVLKFKSVVFISRGEGRRGGGEGGENSYTKRTGVLVVPFRG